MSKFPSLPLFVDAYLADTGHLTDAEHGRYLMLLMTMWRSPECKLPDDDDWLAKHFHRSVEDVRVELRPIISEFMRTHGGYIVQHRLLREWSWVRQKGQQSRRAAKSRWNKEKDQSERTSERTSERISKRNAPNLERKEVSFGTTSERVPPVEKSPGSIPVSAELKAKINGESHPRPPGLVATAHLDSALPRPAVSEAKLPSKQESKPSNSANPEAPFSRAEAGKPNGWDWESKPNGNFYAALNSAEQRAWEDHLGSSKRDDKGGLWYPAQWPPGAPA